MKKYMIIGFSFWVIIALTYCFFVSPFLYNKYSVPLFSQDSAGWISILIGVGTILYCLSKAAEDTDNRALSADKKKALYHSPPKRYLSKEPDGLTIGTFKNNYIRIPFLDSPEHQLIIGAPGDNKSSTILNGIIWNFNFAKDDKRLRSMLVVDVKPELSRKGVFEGRQDIKIINPSQKSSCGFDVFFGLTHSSSDDEIAERCSMIAETAIKDTGSDNVYFAEAARNIFCAFLMYGFVNSKTFGEIIEEVLDASVGDLIAQILTDPRMEDHKKIMRLVREYDGKTSDGFQDVAMTLKKDLGIFDTDSVKACFSKDNPDKVSPVDLVNGTSIFLAIPDYLLTQYASVFRLILNMCMTYIIAQDEATLKDKRPIWVLLDEFPSLLRLPVVVDNGLARGRSKLLQCTLIVQSEGQLDAIYGNNTTRSIKDCCKTTIVFGSNDGPTCKALAERTGMYSESKTSTTTRGGELTGDSSKNESSEYRPAVDIADIQNLPDDGKVLVFAKGGWFICDKAPYYKVPLLSDKSAMIEKQNEEFHHRKSSD